MGNYDADWQSNFHAAEEAQKSVRGMEENAIHNKYIELVCPFLSGILRVH